MKLKKFKEEPPKYSPEHRQQCKSDIFYWIQHHVNIFDYREKENASMKFTPFDFQKDLINSVIHSIENNEDLIIKKDQGIGATWTILIVFLWYWLFHNCYGFLVCGQFRRFLSVVGNMTTLMDKILFVLNNQPDEFLPPRFKQNYKKYYKYKCLKNPLTNSTITLTCASTALEPIATYTAVLYDEMARFKNALKCWQNGANATNVRIAVSSIVPDTKRKQNEFTYIIENYTVPMISINMKDKNLVTKDYKKRIANHELVTKRPSRFENVEKPEINNNDNINNNENTLSDSKNVDNKITTPVLINENITKNNENHLNKEENNPTLFEKNRRKILESLEKEMKRRSLI